MKLTRFLSDKFLYKQIIAGILIPLFSSLIFGIISVLINLRLNNEILSIILSFIFVGFITILTYIVIFEQNLSVRIKKLILTQLRQTIDILFYKNLIGTVLGVLLGVIITVTIKDLYYEIQSSYMNNFGNVLCFSGSASFASLDSLQSIKWWVWIAIWIFLFNIPYFFKKRSNYRYIENILNYIQKSKKNKITSEIEIKTIYRTLYIQILERIELEINIDEESENAWIFLRETENSNQFSQIEIRTMYQQLFTKTLNKLEFFNNRRKGKKLLKQISKKEDVF